MINKYKVVVPGEKTKLNFGFSAYSENKIIICEAATINELLARYPEAVLIQKIENLKQPEKTNFSSY